MIDGDRLDMEQIRSCKVFNYTPLAFGICLSHCGSDTKKILKVVKESGIMILLRPQLPLPYTDQKGAGNGDRRDQSAQILKLTLQELPVFLGKRDIYTATEKLLDLVMLGL